MNSDQYQVYYYKNSQTGKAPVLEYILRVPKKERAKILKYIDFLAQHKGYLDEPYSRHIKGKIRELRVDFFKNRHRIFYLASIGKQIILLHAFLKRTKKTPQTEINRALNNLGDWQLNQSFIKYEH